MEEIELKVVNLEQQTHGEAFSLILKEKDGERFLPVIIGLPEGRLIVIELTRTVMKRPFAHDLLLQLCEKTDCTLEKVVIDDYEDGIFYVHIHLLRHGEVLKLDSRVSDAVVLALKTGAPIYTLPAVFVAAGYTKDGPIGQAPHRLHPDDDELLLEPGEDEEQEEIVLTEGMDFTLYSVEELTQLLHQAVETENYEVAALIDAELNKRPDYAKEK